MCEDELKKELNQINWEDYYKLDDPTECWEFIYNRILKILDKLCPEKTFNNVKKMKEWPNAEIFERMHDRDRKYKEARKSKEPDDWTLARQSRNIVNEMCKRAKEEYVKCKLEEDKGDPKNFGTTSSHFLVRKVKEGIQVLN